MRVTVNPDTQASGEFSYAAPGEYSLRVATVTEKKKVGGEWPYLEWRLEFADPNIPAVEAGKKVGNIFEITTLKPDGQFTLRNICEALGLTWGDFDTDETIGHELRAKVKIKEYNGRLSNEVDKFVPAKR